MIRRRLLQNRPVGLWLVGAAMLFGNGCDGKCQGCMDVAASILRGIAGGLSGGK